MKDMPRLKLEDHDLLYEYVKELVMSRSGSRPRNIDDLLQELRDRGITVTEENPANWLNRNVVRFTPQERPRLCSMFLPAEETLDAIELDDAGGGGNADYDLPAFYKDMFKCDGSGNVIPRQLTPAERKDFRKKRLADYMTQKCF